MVKMIWTVGLCYEGVHGMPVSPSCVAVFRHGTDYKTAKRRVFVLDKT